MPLYYFHLCSGCEILLDPEGIELDEDAVAHRALLEARAIIADDAQSGRIMLDQRIEVIDASGRSVHCLHFVDAVEIIAEGPPLTISAIVQASQRIG